ncbi:hypothetical protein PVAP13_2KG044916 [Panicum virgatum]|uniref:Secreted protein n=1 Tax=Panicum virgatum TaxID=38727 RepID=A0A8T0VSB9_PANVG|nr:hypothetical protein PVAP13_2KG044916 [Panicum virgatum]
MAFLMLGLSLTVLVCSRIWLYRSSKLYASQSELQNCTIERYHKPLMRKFPASLFKPQQFPNLGPRPKLHCKDRHCRCLIYSSTSAKKIQEELFSMFNLQ